MRSIKEGVKKHIIYGSIHKRGGGGQPPVRNQNSCLVFIKRNGCGMK